MEILSTLAINHTLRGMNAELRQEWRNNLCEEVLYFTSKARKASTLDSAWSFLSRAYAANINAARVADPTYTPTMDRADWIEMMLEADA